MSARYVPVAHDAELDDAFGIDNDDDEDDKLTDTTTSLVQPSTPSIPGTYDFEREYEYDYPPPGSPPRPSSVARPNDYGNSNGRVPTSPVHRSPPQPSFVRRAVGALLPQHYARVPTSDSTPSHPIGGGIENDGVFANVMAKPQAPRTVRTENGEVYLVPEEVQREPLPSYSEAQADAVPPYWETVVHAPANPSGSDFLVDDLPTGSVFIFILNIFISYFLQFIGFLLTYILHTTHAAKFGSRAGLGLTLIQLGFYSRVVTQDDNTAQLDNGTTLSVLDFNNGTDPTTPVAPIPDDNISFSSKDFLSIFFMSIGWFLFISSLIGYWRVKRWEKSVRSSQAQQTPTLDQIERDRAIRRQLENAFVIPTLPHPIDDRDSRLRFDEQGNAIIIPNRETLAEARLARDLRAAGLI